MEEISYKLKSGNSLLVVSAVEKLLSGVRSEGGAESEALRVLRDSCSSPEPAVALAACQGLLSLAENGVLSPAHTMSTMLAMLPSAKNYTAIVSTITGLLTLELRSPVSDYRSRFTLKSPQHPLVTVLEKSPPADDDVLGQIQAVCCHPHFTISDNSLELLRPVFIWFLCHPTEERSFNKRALCWRFLLSLQNKGQMALIKECLLWQQVTNPKNLEAGFQVYSILADVATQQKKIEILLAVIPALARISFNFIKQGRDPRPCYNSIERCLDGSPEGLKPCVALTVALLAENALRSPALYLHSLYALCHKLITKYEVPSMSLSILIAYSLQWLHSPSYLTSEAMKVVADLLEIYQSQKSYCNQSHAPILDSNHLFKEIVHTDRKLFLMHEHFKNWDKIKNDKDKIEAWINGLKDNSHRDHIADNIPVIFGVVLEKELDDEVVVQALKVCLEIVKNDNDLAVLALPVLLYKVAKESGPKVKLECLKGMPQMARFKPNVPSVVAVLNRLKLSRGAPSSLLLRLFTDLVSVQSRCYPYLQELLLDAGCKSDVDLKWEVDIAKAEAVRSICETRASIYGAELVSVISGILNRCNDQAGTIASGLALEALRSLWVERIVSPASTWQALAPKMTRDRRPGVHISLCKLLSEVPHLRNQSPEYERFTRDVARILWNYIADSNEPEVIVAACKSLANFKLEDYTLKDIPEIYRQVIKLPAAYCKTPIDAARNPEDVLDYIPAEVWPNVLKNTNQSGLPGVQFLISEYMDREIKGYRSGVYQTENRAGKLEPDNMAYLPAHSVVRGVMEFVRKQALHPAYDCPDTVLLAALTCLNQPRTRPLPPLDTNFIHELFHRGGHLRRPSVLLGARQALVSPAAKRFSENYLQGLEAADGKEEDMSIFYDVLPALCRTIPPVVIRPVLQNYMSNSFAKIQNVKLKQTQAEEIDEVEFVRQVKKITLCLGDEKIHEANATLLSQILEGYWDVIADDNVAWPAYEIAVCALSTKYLERMTSPSSWWETTSLAVRRSARVRSRLACLRESETPLVWLNEIIGAAVECPSEHAFMLECISTPLRVALADQHSRDWLLQLMARVQITIADSPDDRFGLSFLCDVFVLSVVLLSGRAHAGSEDVGETFPSAVAAIIDRWQTCSVQMIEWLQHTRTVDNLPQKYRLIFHRALIACRHDPHFAKPTSWSRILSVRPPE